MILSRCCTELTVTSRSEDSKSGRWPSLIYWLLICRPPEEKSAQGHLLARVPSAGWAGVTALLAVCVCGAQGHRFCCWFCMCTAGWCTHYVISPLKSRGARFFCLSSTMPSSQRSKTYSFMLKKHFSALRLNQASVTLCSPFPTQTVDVQLQVCSIQRHLRYFSPSGYCSKDERVRGVAASPSVRIDNARVRLFLWPVFCGYLTWQSNVLPAAPLALIRVKYVPSPNVCCSSTFRHMSALNEREELQLQESSTMLTRSSPCQTSFYRGSPRMCWWERKDFE